MVIVVGIILGVIAWCCLWGVICNAIALPKNINYGFLLGFFLGLIGLIIVICLPENTKNSVNDVETLEKLVELKEKGILSEAEFKEKKESILKKI